MKLISGMTYAEVYAQMLHSLIYCPEYRTAPRGKTINEHQNVLVEIHYPCSNMFTNSVRGVPIKYLVDELLLYFSGRCDKAGFVAASKFWDAITPDGEEIKSAYGNLIFVKRDTPSELTQWEWAKTALVKDKDSRQALLHFNRTEHQSITNKDFVCTLSGLFSIRDNKLNFTINRRSNDIIRGVTFDFVFEMLLMQCMLIELRPIYPDLKLGKYSCFINSLHIYEEHFELAKNMLNAQFIDAETPRIVANPILNRDIIDMSYGQRVMNDDLFIGWLNTKF